MSGIVRLAFRDKDGTYRGLASVEENYLAQRNPRPSPEVDGPSEPSSANTPA